MNGFLNLDTSMKESELDSAIHAKGGFGICCMNRTASVDLGQCQPGRNVDQELEPEKPITRLTWNAWERNYVLCMRGIDIALIKYGDLERESQEEIPYQPSDQQFIRSFRFHLIVYVLIGPPILIILESLC